MKMRYCALALLAVCVTLAPLDGTAAAAGPEQANIEAALVQSAKTINQQLPVMVDKVTRLDLVMAAGKQLFYKYTIVNTPGRGLDKAGFSGAVRPMLVTNACTAEETRKLLQLGVSYNYIYIGSDGVVIDTIKVGRADCGR